MKLLVCGDRNWTNGAAIMRELKRMKPQLVIHGGARGADTLAGEAAKSLGIKVKVFPAQWDKFQRAAGPIRNQQMLDEGKPNKVLAFHADIVSSKGTKDMLKRADRAGIPTKLCVK